MDGLPVTTTSPSTRKTIDKAMQVMTAFTQERPELAVTELADRLGMHKSVISRIAATLRAWGMLEVNPVTKRLRVGPAAFRIGSLFSHHRNGLADIAGPLLADLVHHTGQSCHLSVLEGTRLLVIATVESPSSLRVIMRVGDERHLHTTAAGKLFLALSGPELLQAAYRATRFRALTPQTITSPDEMQRGFARIRREKVAYNRGENTEGAGAVAAPVLAKSGEVVAVVSTVFPLHVVDATRRALIERHTRTCAESLSAKVAQSPQRSFP
jgi:IclR family transcriptional regulator, KDG regulon repressor